MKITKAHYQHMAAAMLPLMEKYPKPDGMSDKLYRWEIARGAGMIRFMCDELYIYLNDDHIDTALRNITGTR